VLNDLALGNHFGGEVGFREKLKEQGFCAIEVLEGPKEFAAAKRRVAQAPGNWSGPWSTKYSWEVEPKMSDEKRSATGL
jgi:hypothetical protein